MPQVGMDCAIDFCEPACIAAIFHRCRTRVRLVQYPATGSQI